MLVLNPADDPSFSDLAERLLEHDGLTPLRMQAALRQRYPRAVVRRRELAGERLDVWYVYRDGRWIRPTRDAPGT